MPFWNTQVFLQFILFALNKLKVLLWGKLAWTLSHYWWFTQNNPQWNFPSINVFVQVVYDKFNCQGFVWEPFRMWLFCYRKKKKSVCNNEGLQVFPGSIGSQYWVELTVQHRTDFLFILIWDRASILSSKNSNTKVF